MARSTIKQALGLNQYPPAVVLCGRSVTVTVTHASRTHEKLATCSCACVCGCGCGRVCGCSLLTLDAMAAHTHRQLPSGNNVHVHCLASKQMCRDDH
eukprot:355317-Chlamydomonas_euryale.AAC.2